MENQGENKTGNLAEDRTTSKILVFGGTIEGRRVSEYLSARGVSHTVSVATEYGEEVLLPRPGLSVHQGRMDAAQMCEFLAAGGYELVIDATHPFAVEVSANIRRACEREQVPYLRYLRAGNEAEGTGRSLPEKKPYADTAKTDRPEAYEASKRLTGPESPQTDPEEQAAGAGDVNPAGEGAGVVYVNSTDEAARYLERKDGIIFLTTGSKELHIFTEIISDIRRLFARVLPSAEVIAACRALGLEGRQICAMQGPFSEEINEAMLRQTGAAFLVSKDTGVSGGFPEKARAARRCGVTAVIIRRPRENGADWDEVKRRLDGLLGEKKHILQREAVSEEDSVRQDAAVSEEGSVRYNAAVSEEISVRQDTAVSEEDSVRQDTAVSGEACRISCIGIGPGRAGMLTREAADTIRSAQVLFGASRILETACSLLEQDGAAGKPELVPEYSASKIRDYLMKHPQYQKAAILMSGDVGFYSGARAVAEVFPAGQVRYYCGISSVAYFAAKIPAAWQDAKLLSAHGKELALAGFVRRYPKIILLVSGARDVERLCRELADYGCGQVRVTVGTNLSYPEETVKSGTPSDFLHCETAGLHIMMVENPKAGQFLTPGIPDEAFVRGRVPMTKEEIRILSVSKLRLTEEAVIYDVGAGTGSVSVECARLCASGTVYAIEKNPEGIGLIRNNARSFGVSNLKTVEGTAPEALDPLPAPTHAFIGGSSGNLSAIVAALRGKNPHVRIVINTISLESIAEVMDLIRREGIDDAEIVQISAAKSRTLGRYHMMTANNPVYIISFGGDQTVL